jgi:hypothetical protein
MWTPKTNVTQAGQPDRQTAPVASNQPRENLVRVYVLYYELFFLYCKYLYIIVIIMKTTKV